MLYQHCCNSQNERDDINHLEPENIHTQKKIQIHIRSNYNLNNFTLLYVHVLKTQVCPHNIELLLKSAPHWHRRQSTNRIKSFQ